MQKQRYSTILTSRDSFIQHQSPNMLIRCLKTVDIFSFIPVPKDEPVSTKQSLVGTGIFFLIFLVYVIYDFVNFVTNNPPIEESYLTSLDNSAYQLPNFAVAFMQGQMLNETKPYNDIFNYTFQKLSKSQGKEISTPLNNVVVTKENSDQYLEWMGSQTKSFYSLLRTPTDILEAKGLLYSSAETIYSRLKISLCNNSTGTCNTTDEIKRLSASGRLFLFVQNIPDSTSISRDKKDQNGNNYLLYNFFIEPGLYKRVTVQFQVVQYTIFPDYLNRWSTETATRVEVEIVSEQSSNVQYFNTSLEVIAFNLKLSPLIRNIRVNFSTLINRISMWGALWSVLFTGFAVVFLGYNRRKFYKKNPGWDKFKKQGQLSLNDQLFKQT